jgi:hypothetical protein
LLKLALKDGLPTATSRSHKPAWFRSEEGRLRYCRYSLNDDPCDGPEYYDFEQVNGQWTSRGDVLTSICVSLREALQNATLTDVP